MWIVQPVARCFLMQSMMRIATKRRPTKSVGQQRGIDYHAHRQSRQAVFDMVHALRKQGLSFSEIARRTGYGRRSIAKWLTYDEPPDRRRATPKPISPRCFEVYLAVRWKDGILRGRDLFDEIKQRGYIGSFSNLERLLASWRRTDKASNSVARSSASAPAPFKLSAARTLDPATGHVISPVVAVRCA
ncbi:hypothetical protein RFM23_24365 [Mesorhizobium abyssinicae]|uniref:HTH IS21-type domain-containing protein n=1 Tax=Mesorhizobium abyssinicae TaxID=1209958 RepID=A0ABU5AU90_9HYPH|nr:hypothetical protein [Mesorhizobium abyssinicae]MDX8540754.1 hypothetical protein [Mesorhizobium abyssinicae]